MFIFDAVHHLYSRMMNVLTFSQHWSCIANILVKLHGSHHLMQDFYLFVSRIVVYSTNNAVSSFCSFYYFAGRNSLSLDKRKCPCIVSYHLWIVYSRVAYLLAYICCLASSDIFNHNSWRTRHRPNNISYTSTVSVDERITIFVESKILVVNISK